jgi:hypothetical protein
MESTENQVKNFISRCEDLRRSQFILASTKIADLLRAVASSPDILALFKEVTSSFDYFAAQNKYFRPVEGRENRAELLLPTDRRERLAFLFCLLTDIDSEKLNMSAFLQVFFDEEDGYDASFTRFCHALVSPLERDVADELGSYNTGMGGTSAPRSRNEIKAEAIDLAEEERRLISLAAVDTTDLAAGKAMIGEYLAAIGEERISAAEAILLGYHYFILYVGIERTNVIQLLKLTEEL